MKRSILLAALVATLCSTARIAAQRSTSTSLVVRVAPEARVDPARLVLRFRVSADGTGDIASQSQSVAAQVRAAPGQSIRLTASLSGWTGPDGQAALPTVRWTGSATGATAGGRTATCTSGWFAGGAPVDMVTGWSRSGGLTCAMTFSLADPRSLPPGTYTAAIDLSLGAE